MTIKKAEIADNFTPATDDGEWTLHIGCHRGTMMSRDSTKTNHKSYIRGKEQLKSLDDCIECAKDYAKNWQTRGYYVWFANAISPTGEEFLSIVPSVRYS